MKPLFQANIDAQAVEALAMFKSLLKGKRLSRESPVFEKALTFIQHTQLHRLPDSDREEFRKLVMECFSLTDTDLLGLLSNIQVEEHPTTTPKSEAAAVEAQLWSILPKGGYLEQYATYTKSSEAPLAYHVFCGLVAIGLICNRKVWFNMGYYRLYPPLAVFLLGPSGLRKTSAANIMIRIIQDIEVTKVYPEKLTPEVLVGAVKENPHGLLYGPEMSSTLGKQKYLEGLIPLITRLQDCPDVYLAETIGRGKELLRDVAISVLMCSTPDWFASNTPADTFGGGFIARNIMVMQTDTPREEDIPNPAFPSLRDDLVERLITVGRQLEGEMYMDTPARKFHREWYHAHRETTKHPEHPLLGTYYQRKPDHMKKIAMCLQLAEHYNLTLTQQTLEQSINLCNWIEQFIPPMLNTMFRTPMGEQHSYVLQVLASNNGVVAHSTLVRKVQHRMNASQLKVVLGSLKEAGQIKEISNNLQHVWLLEKGS